MKRSLCLAISALSATSVWAQSELSGLNRYPQFRTLSGLPGGMFGIGANGTPSFGGAIAISTPIAYSLSKGHYAFGIANTSGSSGRFVFIERGSSENRSNGTGFGMAGWTVNGYDLSASYMILSSKGDAAYNLHVSPHKQFGEWRLGVGVQDATSIGGASGETIDLSQGSNSSRSYYVVGTRELERGAFVSLGLGNNRFKNGFINGSYPLNPRLKAILEQDGFNWNVGLAVDAKRFTGAAGNPTLFLGLIRLKYPTWGITASF